MAKHVVLDELHLTVRVSSELSDEQTEGIRRTLGGKDFMSRLRQAIRAAFRAFPELSPARVSLGR